ncbi:MAG: type II toxin-antitoxin system VapC family toxin [Candidatus Thorarchaeota archaeon]|nr:type II toxin-antitoxin system VapC family toxin [Candidatus Thorarchaeota archaeon]
MSIFVDTSGFFDFYNSSSAKHEDAVETMKEIQKGRWGQIVTTNYVLDELLTLICYKIDHQSAVSFGKDLRKSDVVIVFIDKQLEKHAWNYFKALENSEISFTDYTSFVVINRLNVDSVFTFDRHFTMQGFNVVS